MRIAVLWTGLSGYLNACLKEVASREGVELFVSNEAPVQASPFDNGQFVWIPNRLEWCSEEDLAPLGERLRAFDAEIVVLCGWHVPAYRRIAKQLAGRCLRVMAFDNPWKPTLKQRMGVLSAPWYVRPLADAAWVPGERQASFARRLGFAPSAMLRGSLSCDQPAFEKAHLSRLADGRGVPHSFLFLGRFVPEKGIDRLAAAYRIYRETSRDPWPLICCGAGPLASLLEGKPGIRVEGFVQPDRLPEKLASAGCLVLPSNFDPWAVVVHEATAAGLMILASEEVGATVHLVQDNYNGYIFDSQDVKRLAALMTHVSSLSESRLDAMSQASHRLSKQFSPARWADTLLEAHRRFTQR